MPVCMMWLFEVTQTGWPPRLYKAGVALSSAHNSWRTVLGNLKWLRSQSYSSNSTTAAIIVNGVFSTISHGLLDALMQRVGVLIVDLFITNYYISLKNALFDIINGSLSLGRTHFCLLKKPIVTLFKAMIIILIIQFLCSKFTIHGTFPPP